MKFCSFFLISLLALCLDHHGLVKAEHLEHLPEHLLEGEEGEQVRQKFLRAGTHKMVKTMKARLTIIHDEAPEENDPDYDEEEYMPEDEYADSEEDANEFFEDMDANGYANFLGEMQEEYENYNPDSEGYEEDEGEEYLDYVPDG